MHDVRKNAGLVLMFVVVLQLLYFVVMLKDPLSYISVCLLICIVMVLVLYLLPDLSSSSSQLHVKYEWICNVLPYLLISIALFKIATRSEIYLSGLTGGLLSARKILEGRTGVNILASSVNVFLIPLWINLLVLRGCVARKHRSALVVAIGIVPLIGVLDLIFFGARVTLAYEMTILFIVGILTLRVVAVAGVFFVVGFVFVHATRVATLYQLGAEYLTLTASGRTLGGIHDLSSLGLADWWVGVAVFFQYIAHPVGELIDLSQGTPFFQPSLVTIADQLAIVHVGNREATSAMMAQINPGNGAYQTFFGVFLVDFGFIGYLVAVAAVSATIAVAYVFGGQFRRVLLLIVATNVALAPIENFFIIGAGLFNFILSLAIAVILSITLDKRSAR